MAKLITKIEDFVNEKLSLSEVSPLNESIERITIPGFQYVSIENTDKSYNIITSNQKFWRFNIEKIFSDVKADYKTYGTPKPEMGLAEILETYYHKLILARYDSDICDKICMVDESAKYAFLTDRIKPKEFNFSGYDMCEDDILCIQNKWDRLKNGAAPDGISPEGIVLLTEHLNTLIEIIAGLIYSFLKSINLQDEIDEYKHANKVNASDHTIKLMEYVETEDLGQSTYINHQVDYKTGMRLLTKIVNKAANLANVELEYPRDYYSGRDINATTIYIEYPIKDSDNSILTILSPVELKKITNSNEFVFFITSISDMEQDEETYKNEKDLANALKKKINESFSENLFEGKNKNINSKGVEQEYEDEYGYDLTHFKPGGFQKVLFGLKMHESSARVKINNYWVWMWEKPEGIIVTSCNPINGDFADKDRGGERIDYASYMGVSGKKAFVKHAKELISKYAEDIKDESPKRNFI